MLGADIQFKKRKDYFIFRNVFTSSLKLPILKVSTTICAMYMSTFDNLVSSLHVTQCAPISFEKSYLRI